MLYLLYRKTALLYTRTMVFQLQYITYVFISLRIYNINLLLDYITYNNTNLTIYALCTDILVKPIYKCRFLVGYVSCFLIISFPFFILILIKGICYYFSYFPSLYHTNWFFLSCRAMFINWTNSACPLETSYLRII